MKRWLRDSGKLAAFAVAVYIGVRFLPAEGWYILTAIALAWLVSLSKLTDRMMRIPLSHDKSAAMSLAMPPPLRAKYTFTLTLDPRKIAERLQLTTDEQAVLEQCERWPRAVQVDQWGSLLRWRFFVRNEDAAVGEWDTKRKEWITFWEAPLAQESTLLSGPRLVFDWGEGHLRLYADGGRFSTASYRPGPSIHHTQSVLMAVSFPSMSQRDRTAYRDAEHYDFMDKYGADFPHSSQDYAEHLHDKSDGVEWWGRLYDYRPEISGTVIKSKIVEKHPAPEWRTQFLVEFGTESGAEGERWWLPSEKIEPDKNGSTVPPNGARVVLTLALDDEGGLEVARVRPQYRGSQYSAAP